MTGDCHRAGIDEQDVCSGVVHVQRALVPVNPYGVEADVERVVRVGVFEADVAAGAVGLGRRAGSRAADDHRFSTVELSVHGDVFEPDLVVGAEDSIRVQIVEHDVDEAGSSFVTSQC